MSVNDHNSCAACHLHGFVVGLGKEKGAAGTIIKLIENVRAGVGVSFGNGFLHDGRLSGLPFIRRICFRLAAGKKDMASATISKQVVFINV